MIPTRLFTPDVLRQLDAREAEIEQGKYFRFDTAGGAGQLQQQLQELADKDQDLAEVSLVAQDVQTSPTHLAEEEAFVLTEAETEL